MVSDWPEFQKIVFIDKFKILKMFEYMLIQVFLFWKALVHFACIVYVKFLVLIDLRVCARVYLGHLCIWGKETARDTGYWYPRHHLI